MIEKIISLAGRQDSKQRLIGLSQAEQVEEEVTVSSSEIDFQSRLSKAGFYTVEQKRFAVFVMTIIVLIICIFCSIIAAFKIGFGAAFGAILVGLYLGALVCLFGLRILAANLQREVMFRLPIFLESVILLVESGLGVLPALQKVVTSDVEKSSKDPVLRIMKSVYDLSSSGLPFAQSLEIISEKIDNKPLCHVLLHLDISSSEGGALIPSLRGLSEYAHREWKLTVEARVKRLENLVVFPVFASVIGLMILTVAVPIVPVVDFFGTLDNRKQNVASPSSPNLGSLR